jgi:hypothetical protein
MGIARPAVHLQQTENILSLPSFRSSTSSCNFFRAIRLLALICARGREAREFWETLILDKALIGILKF